MIPIDELILFSLAALVLVVSPGPNMIYLISRSMSKGTKAGNNIIAERQGLKRRAPNDSLDIYLIPDPMVIDYWILYTRKNIAFKNLTKQQLNTKLDSLKLPKDLKLIDVYEY